MGHVHLNAQEYEEAVACWETILRDHPGSDRASGAAINAASVQLQVLGDPDCAYARLTASLRNRTIRARTSSWRTSCSFSLRRAARVRERPGAARGAPLLGPRHDLIQDLIPVVLWKTGDEPAARRRIEASSTARPTIVRAEQPGGHAGGPRCRPRFGRRAAARAIVLSGTRHDIWDTYAEALFRSGQIEQAIEAQEKAVALATAQKDQAEYRQRLARYKAARKPARGSRRQRCSRPLGSSPETVGVRALLGAPEQPGEEEPEEAEREKIHIPGR